MKIKNLKINKSLALLTFGLVLSEGITLFSFIRCGNKPFTKNKFKVHKVITTEYNKDGITKSEKYASKQILRESIILKTPYYKNIDGKYERDLYSISTNNLSDEEVNYLLNNVSNQRELLNQDYIQDLIEKNKGGSELFKYVNHEEIDKIPADNNYEVAYAIYDEDLNDVKMISSKVNDVSVSFLYSLISTFELALGISYYRMIKDNKIKKKSLKIC